MVQRQCHRYVACPGRRLVSRSEQALPANRAFVRASADATHVNAPHVMAIPAFVTATEGASALLYRTVTAAAA